MYGDLQKTIKRLAIALTIHQPQEESRWTYFCFSWAVRRTVDASLCSEWRSRPPYKSINPLSDWSMVTSMSPVLFDRSSLFKHLRYTSWRIVLLFFLTEKNMQRKNTRNQPAESSVSAHDCRMKKKLFCSFTWFSRITNTSTCRRALLRQSRKRNGVCGRLTKRASAGDFYLSISNRQISFVCLSKSTIRLNPMW